MVIAGSDATTFQSECKDKYRWMARERFGISEEEPTQTGEVYSYGCIMIMLLSGHRPYHWHSEQDSFDIIVARIDDKEPFKQFGDLDNEPKLKQLAQQCLLESGQQLLSNLQINQIPKAALLTCDSNDCSNIGRALKYNWLHGSNATVVAVKTLDVGDLNDIDIDKTCNMIRREVYIRERLKHETILDLYGMTTGFGILPSFVYPWMVHGSLHDYLEREFFTLFPHNKLNIVS
ncbi:hypothetical protein BDR07DRAFT_774307 [Suillus spraguei]|nr:hypothetical protein BDR07DRAFT_774307 [Suillus spraguei]